MKKPHKWGKWTASMKKNGHARVKENAMDYKFYTKYFEKCELKGVKCNFC